MSSEESIWHQNFQGKSIVYQQVLGKTSKANTDIDVTSFVAMLQHGKTKCDCSKKLLRSHHPEESTT